MPPLLVTCHVRLSVRFDRCRELHLLLVKFRVRLRVRLDGCHELRLILVTFRVHLGVHLETCDGLSLGALQPLEQHAACRVVGLAQRERRELLQSKLAHEGGVAHRSLKGLVDHAVALALGLSLC